MEATEPSSDAWDDCSWAVAMLSASIDILDRMSSKVRSSSARRSRARTLASSSRILSTTRSMLTPDMLSGLPYFRWEENFFAGTFAHPPGASARPVFFDGRVMKVLRATQSGRKAVSSHGLLADDTVATAAAKLERTFGSRVYMWCRRAVDAHEALAVSVAGGIHETGAGNYDPAIAARELKNRFGLSAPPGVASSPLKLLKFLKKQPEGSLSEPVSMRNREVIPGGYFSSEGVDPYDDPRPDEGFSAGRSRPFNTGDLLLESFATDRVFFTTRKDLESARPKGVAEKRWKEGFLDRYFPDAEDRDLFKWSERAERQLREQRKSPPAETPVITYLPLTGGTPVGTVGIDRIMNGFASIPATKTRPVVRMQGGGIDRPVSRVHSEFSDEDAEKLRTPAKREWIQAVIKLKKGSATVTVFPSGAYKLQIRFGYLERATMEDAAAYFDGVNEFLEKVSPMIRPVRREHMRPSSSLYIQKPQLLETPSVLGGPRNGVYQTVSVKLPARCEIKDVASVVAARGFPSLKAVNTHAGEFHMQWTRSSALRKSSLVKNLIHHSASNGGMTAARLEELTSELNLTKREVAEIAESKFGRHSVMTLVKAKLSSDATLTVRVNGNDPAYAERVEQTLSNLLRECGKGRSKGVHDWSKSVSESPDAVDAGVSSASDLDEFYEFFDDDEDGDGDGDFGADSQGDGRASADATQGMVEIKQKGDILERLKQADPEVFAFPSRPGYVPYSMKCQKNNSSTRQPLVLSREDAERASSRSSAKGKEAFGNKLEYRGLTYVCPEKWCPVSGVAKGLGEPCPDPDEPEWTMWSSNYPAFQTGVSHPQGLCMPCCFGSKPKRGLKTWNDIKKCKEDAGEEMLETGDEAKAARIKKGHVNKADKLLDEGGFGYAPDDLFPVDMGGVRPVRRGMGARARATLGRSLSYLLGHGSEKALRSSLAEALEPEHFIQGDVREFMTDGDAAEAAAASKSRVKAWMSKAYSDTMGLKRSDLDPRQVVREARVMLAHAECKKRLAGGGSVSEASVFRFVNSGALGNRPVMLVEMDEAGNAYAEHVPEMAMPAEGKVAVVLKRRDTYEPVGRKDKNSFDPWWEASHPWIGAIFGAVRAVVPRGDKRVVSYSMMSVGTLTATGYLPFSRPVFVDPAYDHVHISDRKLSGPASDADAEEALELTGNAFYRIAWKDVAESSKEDDEKDAMLFMPAREDKRIRTMERLNAKLDEAKAVTAALADNVEPAAFAPVPGESSRNRIARIRRQAKEHLSPDVSRNAVDFAIESLLRPVPSGVVPTVRLGPTERIIHA